MQVFIIFLAFGAAFALDRAWQRFFFNKGDKAMVTVIERLEALEKIIADAQAAPAAPPVNDYAAQADLAALATRVTALEAGQSALQDEVGAPDAVSNAALAQAAAASVHTEVTADAPVATETTTGTLAQADAAATS